MQCSLKILTQGSRVRPVGFSRSFAYRVVSIDDANWDERVVKASATEPVLVDFTAKWCGPCQSFETVCKEEGVILAKYDIDESSEQSDHYGLTSIPTVFGFSKGKPISKFTGVKPEADLRKFLQELKKDFDGVKE